MAIKDKPGFYFNRLSLDDLREICDLYGEEEPPPRSKIVEIGDKHYRSAGAIDLIYRKLAVAANGLPQTGTRSSSIDRLTPADLEYIFRGRIPPPGRRRAPASPPVTEVARVSAEALLEKLDCQNALLKTISNNLIEMRKQEYVRGKEIRELVWVMRQAWNVSESYSDIDGLFDS